MKTDNEMDKDVEHILYKLGCTQLLPGLFKHPDLPGSTMLDFSATAPDKVLLRLFQLFSEMGSYEFLVGLRQLMAG